MILHGKRLVHLQKWRMLRFAVNPFQNVYAFSHSFSSQANPKEHTFCVSYLVDSLGFSTNTAESISKKVTFEAKGNPDSVLNLLRTHGFTDSQISTIVSSYPLLLIEDPDKSLAPKLKFLQSRGASTSELTEIVSKVPEILGKRGVKIMSVYYDCVKDIMEADKSSKLCPYFPGDKSRSRQENKIRNVLMLREMGMPHKLLFPLLISNYQPIYGKERFEASLKKVVDKGFDPTTSRFVKALHVVYDLSDKTIQEKVHVYQKLGFDVVDVWEIFKKWPFSLKFSEKKITQTFGTLKRCGLLEDEVLSVLKRHPQLIRVSEHNIVNSMEAFISLGFGRDEFTMMLKRFPQCVGYSAESVKKKTELLVKQMKWPLKAMVSNPAAFGYSMEKRIAPRCNVIKVLMSKGLLGRELPSLSAVLSCTDQAFLNRYVEKHDKLVPELMAIFTRDRKALLEQ